MEIPTAFGLVLKRSRKNKALSQEQLADITNLDRTFISLMERGERQPTLTTLIAIAKALNVAASDLITEVEAVLNEAQ